jgi:hypothetical protein
MRNDTVANFTKMLGQKKESSLKCVKIAGGHIEKCYKYKTA